MLKDADIIVFGTDYGRHPDCVQRIITVLAETNRVLWVNSVGKRTPRLSRYDLRRSITKALDVLTQPRSVNPRIVAVSPAALPLYRSRLWRGINRRIIGSIVRRKMQSLGFRKPIMVVSVPTAVEYADAIPHCLLVAYYMDNYAEMPFVNRALMREMEGKLLSGSDVSFVPSENLWREKHALARRMIHIPHGVDVEHFQAAYLPAPAEMKKIPRPVAGYVGAMHACLDLDLIRDAAKALPGYSFVLIGNIEEGVFGAHKPRNIFILGRKPYEVVPAYTNAFDVGLIPYTMDAFTRYVNPAKLIEYLACGLPVVSRPLHDVLQYGNRLVHTAESADDFIAAIERAVREDSPSLREERKQFARENSWRARAETFSQEVLRVLDAKRSRPGSAPSRKDSRA
ncbi:MAG: glycosyltransferase [Planctomycetota bacterium]